MKTLCFFLLAVLCVASASEKSAKPSAEPIARYQAMIERSPFALATESTPPPVAADNAGFTKDLVLTGAVRLSNGEYITIASKDHNQSFALQTGATYNDISLVSVAWSDAVGKTRATLKRGTEYGTISFDEAAARAGAIAPVSGGVAVASQTLPPGSNPPPNPSVGDSQPHANAVQPGAPSPDSVAPPASPDPATFAPNRSYRRRLPIRNIPQTP